MLFVLHSRMSRIVKFSGVNRTASMRGAPMTHRRWWALHRSSPRFPCSSSRRGLRLPSTRTSRSQTALPAWRCNTQVTFSACREGAPSPPAGGASWFGSDPIAPLVKNLEEAVTIVVQYTFVQARLWTLQIVPSALSKAPTPQFWSAGRTPRPTGRPLGRSIPPDGSILTSSDSLRGGRSPRACSRAKSRCEESRRGLSPSGRLRPSRVGPASPINCLQKAKTYFLRTFTLNIGHSQIVHTMWGD